MINAAMIDATVIDAAVIDIGIIIGSTRPGRKGETVAGWVHDIGVKRGEQRNDARFEVVDLADFALPSLDEPMPAITGQYTQPHTRTWAATIASFDAYVFVTPEYNHSAPGPLKNAIDFLYAEWTNKAVGFVGYGTAGGARAIEHLRLVMSCLQVAHVSAQVELSLFTDFKDYTVFHPAGRHEDTLTTLLDQVITWGAALKALRTAEHHTAEHHTAEHHTAEHHTAEHHTAEHHTGEHDGA